MHSPATRLKAYAAGLLLVVLGLLLAFGPGHMAVEIVPIACIRFGLVLVQRHSAPVLWTFEQPQSLQRLLPPRSPPLS
jgi:hypothetical protein